MTIEKVECYKVNGKFFESERAAKEHVKLANSAEKLAEQIKKYIKERADDDSYIQEVLENDICYLGDWIIENRRNIITMLGGTTNE